MYKIILHKNQLEIYNTELFPHMKRASRNVIYDLDMIFKVENKVKDLDKCSHPD